jgi:aminoglycoside N3'-acetyltransferase
MTSIRFEELMDELNITSGDVLFVHSSWGRLRFLSLSPIELINKLKERVGKNGLLCMPTYPWIYPNIPFNPQKTFCPDTTPSLCGLLSEIFRRHPKAYRSANPWVPVAASGKLAYDLVSGQESIKDTFSNESVFGRLVSLKVKQLGLGVNIGLSSFIHMAECKLSNKFDFRVSEEINVSMIKLKDRVINNVPFLIIPEINQKIINSTMLFRKRKDLMEKIIFKDIKGVFFYSYCVQDMLDIAFEEAENALRINALPCWFLKRPIENNGK